MDSTSAATKTAPPTVTGKTATQAAPALPHPDLRFLGQQLALSLLGTAIALQLCREGVLPYLWHRHVPWYASVLGHGATVAAGQHRARGPQTSRQQALIGYFAVARATATLAALLLGRAPAWLGAAGPILLTYLGAWAAIEYSHTCRRLQGHVILVSMALEVLSDIGCADPVYFNMLEAYKKMGGADGHSSHVIGWLWVLLVGTISSCGGAVVMALFSLGTAQWHVSPLRLLLSVPNHVGPSACVALCNLLLLHWPGSGQPPLGLALLQPREAQTMVACLLALNRVTPYVVRAINGPPKPEVAAKEKKE